MDSLIIIVSNFVTELWLAAVGLATTEFAYLQDKSCRGSWRKARN